MKNKLIFIFSLLVLVSFIFILNNSFAFTINYNDSSYDVADLPFDTSEHPYYIFGYKGSNEFEVGYPLSSVKDNRFFVSTESSNDPRDNVYRYYIEGTTTFGEWRWFTVSTTQGSSWNSGANTSHGFLKLNSSGEVLASSLPIYESKNSDSIFFPLTPLTVLTPIMERVEMSQEITQTIVGLAGLLIPLLISLIAFWKGWGLLSRVLFKA